MFALLLLYFPTPAFQRVAFAMLQSQFPPDQVRRLAKRTGEMYKAGRGLRTRHSWGVDLMLRYFEWDCALYGALREAGLAQADAGALIEQVNWTLFAPASRLAFALSRLRSGERMRRVQWVYDLLFRWLTTHPFQRKVFPMQDGVAFDVVACPFAEYFRSRGMGELTHHAACSIDVRMAQEWQVDFVRRRTIAQGQPLCDFRFRPPPGGVR